MPEKIYVKALWTMVGLPGPHANGVRQGEVVEANVFGQELQRQLDKGAIAYCDEEGRIEAEEAPEEDAADAPLDTDVNLAREFGFEPGDRNADDLVEALDALDDRNAEDIEKLFTADELKAIAAAQGAERTTGTKKELAAAIVAALEAGEAPE